MSFFTGAQGVEVHGGNFSVTVITENNTYLNGPTGIDILREASAPEAAHDASARSYSPRCFPGTREQYIEDIVRRATPSLSDTPLPIYWMKGPAGVGKSAITQTCAERLQKRGLLGASFFFSISGQHTPEKLFPSIAYQLSTIHPVYRDLVDQRIRRDKTLVDKALQFQFQYLIDEPLRELEECGIGIRKAVQIVVDGLDECEGTEIQCDIIRTIAAAASEGVLPLRWVLFSRPEPHIEAMFSTDTISSYCYKTILPFSRGADGEIELYLRNAFNNISPLGNFSTQNPWPSSEDMGVIVGAARGSFIYAKTVVRYVGHPDSLSPQKRLIAILDGIFKHGSNSNSGVDAPFAELDAFYTLILRRLPPKILPSAHLLLALLCQLKYSSAVFAANLLGMSKDEFTRICRCMSAVVRFEVPGKRLDLDPTINTGYEYTQVDKGIRNQIFRQLWDHTEGRISVYHKSFDDFLLDSTRSGDFCVKASEALANQLVKIHLKLGRSFCWRGLELVLAPGVPDSAASLSYPCTNELANSALKTLVYIRAGNEDPDSFPAPQEARKLHADCDFRKWLYTRTTLVATNRVFSYHHWGRNSWGKYFQGVDIEFIPRTEFPRHVVTKFKLMIKWQEQAGIIRPYHPSLISRIKCPFRHRSHEGVESALYHLGHGEKSIFWYWEIHHKLEYYRGFRSIDLAEGQKKFQEQDFDSWPNHTRRKRG